MPWKSDAQRRWGNSPSGYKALGAKDVKEFNQASKGRELPEKVKKAYKQGRIKTSHVKRMVEGK